MSFQAQGEINPAFCRRLNSCECSARRHKRNIRFARLNSDLSKTCSCVDKSVKNRTELWSICILTLNEIIRRRAKKVRIAKSLPHQQRLSIAGDTLFRQPGSEALFIIELFFR